MRVIRLSAENVKRLSAVDITPAVDGSLVTIGGKNNAGKSSVLDSIAYALGGEKLVPTEPIRTGQKEAKITIDLGDYIVTRRFYRERIHSTECQTSIVQACSCGEKLWSPTKSTLAVTNKEGAKYPSPQLLLDKLYGKLTFDPLAFSRERPDKQDEILRRLVDLDFAQIDAQRKTLFEARAMAKKTLVIQEGKLANMPKHPTAGGAYETTETPLDDVSTAIRRAEELRLIAAEADRDVSKMEQAIENLQRDRSFMAAQIKTLHAQLDALESKQATCDLDVDAKTTTRAALKVAAAEAQKAVPNRDALTTQLRDLDIKNIHARSNVAFLAQEQEVKNQQGLIAEQTKVIEAIDDEKTNALQAAKFPVVGLGLTDVGVTFENLPLAEVASSVQLRVSIAIGLALNPTLKVLLIRNGNLLDDDSLKLVAEQAAAADAQVWMEYVTADSGNVSVMLEDGHLA